MLSRIFMVLHAIFALYIILIMSSLASESETATETAEEQTFEKVIPSDGASLLVVKAINGYIEISSWEKLEVLVKAFITVTEEGDEKAQEYIKKVIINLEKKDDRIELVTEQPADIENKVSVEYYISAPENINLDISASVSSIYITGNRGKEKIAIVSGDIELKDVVGSVSARTNEGNIIADILFDGDSNFTTADGSIDVNILDNFSVPISAETVSGSIDITIPEKFSAEVDAETQSGQVSYDLPSGWEHGIISYEEPGRTGMKGKLFNGGPALKLRAVSGNISIMGMQGAAPDQVETSKEIKEIIEETSKEVTPEKPRKPIRKLEIPLAEAVKTINPPVINGRLDDKCWKDAGKISDFVWADGVGRPYELTEAYLLWDDQTLYIGIKCYESQMGNIRLSNTENDKQVWEDDMVQIFIDPTPETETYYYHLTVNPLGTIIDWEIDRAKERETVESKLGIRWNSGGLFKTDIRSDSWIIEAGIPFSSLKSTPKDGDTWRFNLYRMEQQRKEHSYWSPTYKAPEWPHVPPKFGKLSFVTVRTVELWKSSIKFAPIPAYAGIPKLEDTERPTATKGALTIADIAIEGNEEISKEEILDALELEPGDPADVDTLSAAKRRLESLGWFKNVGMNLNENDKGVDLIVKLVEKEIITPSEVQIRGSHLFTVEQITSYFNFGTFRTALEDVNTKCRLIETLYRSRGYEMAAASYSFISGALVIDVDEGSIGRIEVRGNKKISAKEILDSLDLKSGMPYRRNDIDNAINTLRARLPYFRNIWWESGRSGDGLNMVYINVNEGRITDFNIDGKGEFNRVHGIQWGMTAELKSEYAGVRSYCEFLYGFSSEIWNYQFGMEKSWFRRRKSTLCVDVHRVTDTNDREIISDHEHFIAEAILGESWRDLYQREGYELGFSQKLTPGNWFNLRYLDDDYTSLEKHEDWSLLNRSYLDDENWFNEDFIRIDRGDRAIRIRYKDKKYKPENPPIDEGEMRSLIAEYTIDARNEKRNPANGWLNTFSIEYAGRDLGGDYDFAIYRANIRSYNRLSGNQFIHFRVKAATADRELSDLHPRKFYLGGIGTLRGYNYKEFSGDKMLLINAEYWLMTNWPPAFGIVFFVDSGYAWPYKQKIKMEDMKTSLGVGFQFGALRVDLASPVEREEEDPDFNVSARIARMF